MSLLNEKAPPWVLLPQWYVSMSLVFCQLWLEKDGVKRGESRSKDRAERG